MSHEDVRITIKASGQVIPLAPGPCPECDYPDALYNTYVGVSRHVTEAGQEICPELAQRARALHALFDRARGLDAPPR